MSSKDRMFVIERDTEVRENCVIGAWMSVAHLFWSGVCGVFRVSCTSMGSEGAHDKQTA